MEAKTFCEKLKLCGVSFICGVPDSLLKNLLSCVGDSFENHVITANEGNAVAMAAGHYLATGKPAVIYLQNSGLGNCVNPILSLTDEDVYKIPFLMIVGYRGEPGVKDEPQHFKQGILTLPLLECLGIEYKVFDNIDDIDVAFKYMKDIGKPYALVIRKDTFEPYKKAKSNDSSLMTREDAIIKIAKSANERDIFVSTTGMISRELYEYRVREGLKSQDFLTVGSMGHASSIAYAIAAQKPERTVYILDGDGACLMHMGALPVLAALNLKNVKHIVLNNAAHDSVGGQPTVGNKVNFATIAKACGYSWSRQVSSDEEIERLLKEIQTVNESCFLEIKVKKGNRSDLGRPKETPAENKKKFMDFIANG